jgi:hypothetical protein
MSRNIKNLLLAICFVGVLGQSQEVQAVSLARYRYSPCSQPKPKVDFDVPAQELSFLFEFFDQSEVVINNLSDSQKLMHEMVIVPMHSCCKGSFALMVRLIKSGYRKMSSSLKRAKRIGTDDSIFLIRKRQAQLRSLLVFLKQNKPLALLLWSSVEIEEKYEKLIRSHGQLMQRIEDGERVYQDREFEKDLLGVSLHRIPKRHTKYPMVYFMRRFLLKDLKKYKSQYKQIARRLRSGFAVNLFEDGYEKVVSVKSTIEGLHVYNIEKKALAKKRQLWVVLGLVVPVVSTAIFAAGFFIGFNVGASVGILFSPVCWVSGALIPLV